MTLAHERTGAGPPLVLIHGIGSRRGVWGPVVEMLARERDVIAVDLPGFGESAPLPPEVATSPAGFSRALEAFFDEIGIGSPHVAGNSLGGAIAIELARRGRVASAAALSPAGFFSRAERAYAEALLFLNRVASRALAPVAGSLFEARWARIALLGMAYSRPALRAPAEAAKDVRGMASAPAFWQTLHAMHHHDSGAGPAPEVPVTVGWAEKDRLLIPRQAERARAALPGARHVTLTGCGHVPMSDDPEQVAAVLLEASAGTRAGAAASGMPRDASI